MTDKIVKIIEALISCDTRLVKRKEKKEKEMCYLSIGRTGA